MSSIDVYYHYYYRGVQQSGTYCVFDVDRWWPYPPRGSPRRCLLGNHTRLTSFLHVHGPLRRSFALGIPFERALKFHRWFGRAALVVMVVHGLGMVVEYTRNGQFEKLLTYSTGFATVSLACFLVMYLPSLCRRSSYEVFANLHAVFVLPALAFAGLHMAALGPYVIPALIVVVPDYLYFRWNLARHKVPVVAAVHLPGRVLRLDLHAPSLKSKPGQWVYVTVPEISRTQAHPFSICLTDNSDGSDKVGDETTSTITLFVKDMGPDTFSGRLYNSVPVSAFGASAGSGGSAAATRVSGDASALSSSSACVLSHHQRSAPPFSVCCDGPYGRPSVETIGADAIVLVAGGIGATPIVAHLQSLLRQPDREVTITFSWVFREERATEWFGDVIEDATADSRVDLDLCCTSDSFVAPTESLSSATQRVVSAGRPDYRRILTRVKESGAKRAVVLVCGPSGLVSAVHEAANSCSSAAFAVEVGAETFLF